MVKNVTVNAYISFWPTVEVEFMSQASVCCFFVYLPFSCIVAKQNVLPENSTINIVARQIPCGSKSNPYLSLFSYKRGTKHLQISHCELWPNRFSWQHGYAYYRQPIATCQCPIRRYHRQLLTDTCSPKIWVPTPKLCMAHYGQTVSAHNYYKQATCNCKCLI